MNLDVLVSSQDDTQPMEMDIVSFVEPVIETNRKRKCTVELIDEEEEAKEKLIRKCIACSKEEDNIGWFYHDCFFCEESNPYCNNCDENYWYYCGDRYGSNKPCSIECLKSREHLKFQNIPTVIQEEIGYYFILPEYIRYSTRILKNKNDSLKVKLERYCKNINIITLFNAYRWSNAYHAQYSAIWSGFLLVFGISACPKLHTIDLYDWHINGKSFNTYLPEFTGSLILSGNDYNHIIEDQIKLFPNITHLIIKHSKYRSWFGDISDWFRICYKRLYLTLKVLEIQIIDYHNPTMERIDDYQIEAMTEQLTSAFIEVNFDFEKAIKTALTSIISPNFNLKLMLNLDSFTKTFPKIIYLKDISGECKRKDLQSEWMISKLIKLSTQTYYHEIEEKTLNAWKADKESPQLLNEKRKVNHNDKKQEIEREWVEFDEKIIKEVKEQSTKSPQAIMAIPIKMKKISAPKKKLKK